MCTYPSYPKLTVQRSPTKTAKCPKKGDPVFSTPGACGVPRYSETLQSATVRGAAASPETLGLPGRLPGFV
ncbi:uncharacterized protein LAJ45_03992 [Morchella importuna]|uniref:uncharacterized protein n=1 Tax=Morchella importuna TaxID=1174673 RepID=UPI001E8E76F7|nr:uncharacterized protein LAJ45_03992 [Morchella importuna]KAH8151999.1 hypothetical protein LAJ45_03992 [Morchella importuna]